MTDVEQIVELSQTKTIAQALLYLRGLVQGPITALVQRCMQVIAANGLDGLSRSISGNLAQVRGMEIACVLNRLSTLQIRRR